MSAFQLVFPQLAYVPYVRTPHHLANPRQEFDLGLEKAAFILSLPAK